MKKITFLLICFLFSFCSSQMKLNQGKNVNIILKEVPLKLNTGKATNYLISNSTNNTYIIDPYGFYGKSYTFENDKLLEPNSYYKRGYYSRFDDNDCKRDLIILEPKATISAYLSLDRNNKNIYNYSKNHQYVNIIKSLHNRNNATILGCDKYIESLELKDYKVLEDSIVAKIPLVP
ncbi:hypothetical protein RAH57_17265 [Chryseobacterium sp. CKR4-1]|uniref:hypothetical protein n=1 Tax=Chryseobacterium sp. CKR4-1 TaxID=3068896 RepID=UPI002796B305|nr:hypothetical protein [Chryseobacterium sp. CKR4-1]MDQ1805744.1 hypothetical protein [Chryseobacterium sp. CKR4-1]